MSFTLVKVMVLLCLRTVLRLPEGEEGSVGGEKNSVYRARHYLQIVGMTYWRQPVRVSATTACRFGADGRTRECRLK